MLYDDHGCEICLLDPPEKFLGEYSFEFEETTYIVIIEAIDYLECPISGDEMAKLTDGNGWISGVVRVSLSEMINNDMEELQKKRDMGGLNYGEA